MGQINLILYSEYAGNVFLAQNVNPQWFTKLSEDRTWLLTMDIVWLFLEIPNHTISVLDLGQHTSQLGFLLDKVKVNSPNIKIILICLCLELMS